MLKQKKLQNAYQTCLLTSAFGYWRHGVAYSLDLKWAKDDEGQRNRVA